MTTLPRLEHERRAHCSAAAELAESVEVTIGMPVYNGEEYLRSALDSLLAQEFTGFVLLISDNASTDGTQAICREFAARDSRIRYVCQPQNRGSSFNFNYVLQEARTPYFMWAAHDDQWNPGFIGSLVESLNNNPNAVGAQGEFVIIDSTGGILEEADANHEMERSSRLARLLPLHKARRINMYFYGMYRTAVLKRIEVKPLPLGGGDPRHSEYPILFYLGSAGKILTNRDARFFFREHSSQYSNTRLPLKQSLLLELGVILAVPSAVWKGCHNPLTVLAAFFHITFRRSLFILDRIGKLGSRIVTVGKTVH